MKFIKNIFITLCLGITGLGIVFLASPLVFATGEEILVDTNTHAWTCDERELPTHKHTYTNTTGPTDGIWYSARVKKLRIYLHDDFMNSVDLDSLECSSGGAWISCDGGTSTADGGTKIKIVTGDTSADALYENYVEWTYGNTTASASPEIPGYNDYDGDGTIDTEDEADRTMGETLAFDFKSDISTGDATTTSSVYIKFWAYDVEDGTWTAIEEDGATDYHWNGHTVKNISSFECEETSPLTCSDLSITPTTGDLAMSDVFSNVNFTVKATGSDGSDITGDSTFTYSINKYGSPATAADADGYLHYGIANLFRKKNPTTTDSTVQWKATEPGDSLYVYVSDFNGVSYEKDCNERIELPYCTDLNITDPTGTLGSPFIGMQTGDEYTTNIAIESETSTGEAWPFNVTYESDGSSATFDGNASPYTTTDTTIDEYKSSSSATVSVGLDDQNDDGESDDVAGLCTDSFNYLLMPDTTLPTCEDFTITTPTEPITAEAMEDGNVEISWESTMTNGDPTVGPFICVSTNPLGAFTDITGARSNTSIVTYQNTVFYTGEPGDAIVCSSQEYPETCTDTLTSENSTPGAVCSDLTLNDPYTVASDGRKIKVDTSSPTSLADMYAANDVCFDFSVSVSDTAYSGSLQVSGHESDGSTYAGNLQLNVTQTGGTTVGNPATLAVTGFTAYTGTVCWENYEAGDTLSLEMLGDEATCSEDYTLPELSSSLVCTDLEMTPDSVTLSATETDAGTQAVSITVTGSSTDWSDDLIIRVSGPGKLHYPDGSASEYEDGHLVIPVSGLSTTLNLSYTGGKEGDVVYAFMQNAVDPCSDSFTLSKASIPGGGGGGGSHGGGGGSHGGGGGSPSKTCDDVLDNPDDIFDDNEVTDCEEYSTEICFDDNGTVSINSENNEICYEDEDGEEVCEDDSLDIKGTDGDCYDITVTGNVCEADISVEYKGRTCDEISPELNEIGTLNKYIYTFNFLTEKSTNTEDDVFFSHDEDRAFYTLEYEAVGSEEAVVFTDDMWLDSIDGIDSSGDSTGGNVSLAETFDEVTEYNYSSIRRFGFGDTHEENSDSLASEMDGFTDSNYMTFIPYLKYEDGSDSEMIDACEYEEDEETGERTLSSTGICYDPSYSPESTGSVVIENAGTVAGDATIRIRTVGVIASGIAEDCDSADDECLTETFAGTGYVYVNPDDLEDPESADLSAEDEASLVVLCSYLLTQNAGDIYLEVGLNGGSDISCAYIDDDSNYSGYSNTDGLVILEYDASDEEETSTDATYDSSSSSESISVCDDSSDDNLIGNLSSYVCEIISAVGDLWKKSNVESSTESQISQAVRNADTAHVAGTSATYSTWEEMTAALTNKNNEDSNILYFDGGSASALTLGTLTVPCGAWTLIVENADLNLAGNIQYATSCDDGSNYNVNMPSIGFVVLGGDIFVKTSADHLVGAYYTDQSFTGEGRSAVDEQLFIDGSLYGDVQPLLDAANYVGPPTLDGGSVVIRYDSRILINTPPALSEYVDVETEKAVN